MPYELEHPDNDQIYSQNRPGDLTAWKTIEQLPLHLDQETYYVIACYKIFLRSAQIAHVIQRSHMISSIQDPNPEIPFGGLTCIIHYNGYPRRKISERTIDLILVDMERISHPGHRAWRCYTKWKMEGD
ncbi:MAG: hypothetical protein L6R42_008472, partial [Xanthoria sp. 1 TBL-2021]